VWPARKVLGEEVCSRSDRGLMHTRFPHRCGLCYGVTAGRWQTEVHNDGGWRDFARLGGKRKESMRGGGGPAATRREGGGPASWRSSWAGGSDR
jgi:hypothetical protein